MRYTVWITFTQTTSCSFRRNTMPVTRKIETKRASHAMARRLLMTLSSLFTPLESISSSSALTLCRAFTTTRAVKPLYLTKTNTNHVWKLMTRSHLSPWAKLWVSWSHWKLTSSSQTVSGIFSLWVHTLTHSCAFSNWEVTRHCQVRLCVKFS